MRENLRTRTFDNGDGIVGIEQVGWLPTADDAVFYSVNNDQGYDDSFGLLYNFPAVDAGNLCPARWHVPSNDDWTVLAGYVSSVPEYVCDIDNSGSIARALASKDGWSNVAPVFCNPMQQPLNNNATGFTAMPAGSFESDPLDEPHGSFFNIGVGAYFWTSSSSGDDAFSYVLSTTPDLMQGISPKSFAYSVRCLKDE